MKFRHAKTHKPNPRYPKDHLRHSGDAGDLAITIAVMAVLLLTLIPLATYSSTTNLLPLTRGNQDYQSALAAAESGVANYVNYLEQNSSTSTAPPATTSWVQVPGFPTEYFHYTITGSTNTSVSTVISTGIALHGAQTQTRTIQVTVTPKTFLDYMLTYSSMIYAPSLDTLLSKSGMSASEIQTECGYLYSAPNDNASAALPDNEDLATELPDTTTNSQGVSDTVPTGPEFNTCSPYLFTLNNVPSGKSSGNLGPIMTNDVYYLNNANTSSVTLFSGSATSCNGNGQYWRVAGTGVCGSGGTNPPQYQTPLTFPTVSGLQQSASSGGCYYYGPTQITVSGGSATIYSPETYTMLQSGVTPITLGPAGCYGPTSQTSSLTMPVAWTIKSPPGNGTIFVDNVPTNTGYLPATSPACVSGYITVPQSTTYGWPYPCGQGDAVVSGTVTGGLTIGTANNIVIDGNMLYTNCAAPGSTDITGLVAANSVLLANTTWTGLPTNTCSLGSGSDAVIMAAVLALKGSFTIQSPTCSGGSSTFQKLFVYGNITGFEAGINGFSTGGVVNPCGHNATMKFNYDTRFQTLSSPYFPLPLGTTWTQAQFEEITNPTNLPTYP